MRDQTGNRGNKKHALQRCHFQDRHEGLADEAGQTDILDDGRHEQEADGRHQRCGNPSHALQHGRFAFRKSGLGQDDRQDGSGNADQEDRVTEHEADEQHAKRQEGHPDRNLVVAGLEFFSDLLHFFLGHLNLQLALFTLEAHEAAGKDRQRHKNADDVDHTKTDPGHGHDGNLRRMGESAIVAQVPGVPVDTGRFARIDAHLGRGDTGNDGSDCRLREACQHADDPGGDTTGHGDTRAAAQHATDPDDPADDHVEEAGAFHDADKHQHARHVGDDRVEAADDKRGDGDHILAAGEREPCDDRCNGRADDGCHVKWGFPADHQ